MSAINRAGLGILLSLLIFTVAAGLKFSLPAIFLYGGIAALGFLFLIHERKG